MSSPDRPLPPDLPATFTADTVDATNFSPAAATPADPLSVSAVPVSPPDQAAPAADPATFSPGWATGFLGMSAEELLTYARTEGLRMSQSDLLACQDYYRGVEQRNPTLTELRSLAACRAHQEFETLVQIPLCITTDTSRVLRAYFDAPAELFTTHPAFCKTGSLVALVPLPAMTEGFSLSGWETVRTLLRRATELVEQGYAALAASVTGNDVTATITELCRGGGVAFAFGRDIRPAELLRDAVGGLLLELTGGDLCLQDLPHQVIGTTVDAGTPRDTQP